jgi:MFS family permease
MSVGKHRKSDPAYGWVVVGVGSIMLAAAVGLASSTISVFIKPLGAEYGWQRGALSLVYSTSVVGLALGGIVMGWFADRVSTRQMCLFGSAVLGGCLLLASLADSLWQFYILFFFAGLLGAGAIMVPLLANIGNWFRFNVGLALGFATAGQALGQGAVPYGAALLVNGLGWRDAFMTMGLLVFVSMIPLALLIRQPPPQPDANGLEGVEDGNNTAGNTLSSNTVIVWLSCAVIFCCICMSVPLMHLVPLFQDKGMSLDDAASVLFIVLLAAVPGRIFFGRLADKIGPLRAYLVASFWQTALVYFFVQLNDTTLFYPFAFFYGFGYAGVMTGIIVCVRVMTPLAQRATALGVVTLFAWVGHGIGSFQGGALFDLTGNYAASYGTAALAGIVNLVIVASLYLTINRRKAYNVVAN